MKRSTTYRNITIIDSYNGYNGLELSYIHFGIEKYRELDREETMNVFDSASVITMKDGMVLSEDRWISYEDWRCENELTEEDLKDVVMLIESAEEAKRTCERIMNTKAA